MEIAFINKTRDRAIKEYYSLLQEAAQRVETVLDLPSHYEVSVLFVKTKKIHQINKEYRHIDRPTDVITFAMQDDEMIQEGDVVTELGDIFINVDAVSKQAEEYGHSYRRELCFLFVHGILHCLGYDHMNEDDEKEMFDLQKEILDSWIPR